MRPRAHITGRLIAPLLVVLWIVPCLMALHHAGEHAHRYCAAHSAFEEAPVSSGLARASPADGGVAVEKRTASAPETPGHEVCACLSFNDRKAVVGGELSQRLLSPPPSPEPLATSAPSRAWTSLSVLDRAPKASPPAHA